jgi:hypothetical protein
MSPALCLPVTERSAYEGPATDHRPGASEIRLSQPSPRHISMAWERGEDFLVGEIACGAEEDEDVGEFIAHRDERVSDAGLHVMWFTECPVLGRITITPQLRAVAKRRSRTGLATAARVSEGLQT